AAPPSGPRASSDRSRPVPSLLRREAIGMVPSKGIVLGRLTRAPGRSGLEVAGGCRQRGVRIGDIGQFLPIDGIGECLTQGAAGEEAAVVEHQALGMIARDREDRNARRLGLGTNS